MGKTWPRLERRWKGGSLKGRLSRRLSFRPKRSEVDDIVTMIMSQSNYKIYSTSKDAWDAMYQTILSAKKSIYWELYIFLDDEAGNQFFDLLEQKAKENI